MAKLLAADVSWEPANVAVQTYGGFGFAEDTTSSGNSARPGCIRWRPFPRISS